MQKRFKFKAKVWVYKGISPWHFITVPLKIKEQINFLFGHLKGGWGSLPVLVTVGQTNWKTSIFPDKRQGSYILPLKLEVRKRENIEESSEIKVKIKINL